MEVVSVVHPSPARTSPVSRREVASLSFSFRQSARVDGSKTSPWPTESRKPAPRLAIYASTPDYNFENSTPMPVDIFHRLKCIAMNSNRVVKHEVER